MVEKDDQLPYYMAMFYNRDHLEPPLNYKEFSRVAYEAEMRTNYLSAIEGRCSCHLYYGDPAFKKLAEVTSSDEMKQVKLLIIANELFKRLTPEQSCSSHINDIMDQIKTAMLYYNNKNDRLSAKRIEFVFHLAYSMRDGIEYYHKHDGTECKGYKHQLVWEPDSIVDGMQ
jgi:hypothetical protein